MEHWVHAAAATWPATTADDEPVRAGMGPLQGAQLYVDMSKGYFGYDLPRIQFPFAWPLSGLDPTKGWVIDGIVVRMAALSVKPFDDRVIPPGIGSIHVYDKEVLINRRERLEDQLSPPTGRRWGTLRFEFEPEEISRRRPITGPLSVNLGLRGIGRIHFAAVGISFQQVFLGYGVGPGYFNPYSYEYYSVGRETSQEDLMKIEEGRLLPEFGEFDGLTDDEYKEIVKRAVDDDPHQ